MAQSSVLREFLIAIGFKIDKSALSNLSTGLAKAQSSIIKLGAAVLTVGTTIAVGLQRMSSNLEQLYFASQRTSSSANSLMAFDRAMQNLGASAGEGLQAVEGLADILKTDPGSAGLLTSLIGQLKLTKDGSVDAEDAMIRLGSFLQKQPNVLAYQFGDMFHIPHNIVSGMKSNPNWAEDMRRIAAEQKAANLDKAARDAHRFQVELRDLIITLQAFGIHVWDALQNKFGFSLKSINAWLQDPKNQQRIADWLAGIITWLGKAYDKAKEVFGWLLEKFMAMDEATGGVSTKVAIMLVLLKKFGALDVIAGVFQLTAGVLRLVAAFAPLIASAPMLIALLGAIAAFAAYKWSSGSPTKAGGLGEFLVSTASAMGVKSAQESLATSDPLLFLQQAGGFTREQALGILANAKAESNMNPTRQQRNGPGYGLFQWEGAGQARFSKFAGHDIRESTADEQYNFALYEIKSRDPALWARMHAAKTAGEVARDFAYQYEQPKRRAEDAEARAKMATQMSQDTTINVYDHSGDPQTTAQIVANKQIDTMGQALRALKPAMQ